MDHSNRSRQYRTRAIVLQCRDLGEADRIFTVYTPNHGKLGVIGKGARKTTSRLGPYLDYFCEVDLELTRGRNLDVVTGASAVNRHTSLGHNMDAYGNAAHLAELVRDLTQDRQENQAVYHLLAASLALLDDGVDPWHVARHFELGMLVETGYRPEFLHCSQCQRALEPVPNGYSVALGGMLCPDCASADRLAQTLSVNAQKYLRVLVREGLTGVIRLQPTIDERHEVSQALLTSLRHVGDRDFDSLRVLGTMSVQAPVATDR